MKYAIVCGMELRHFLEKLEVSGSFFCEADFPPSVSVSADGSDHLDGRWKKQWWVRMKNYL